MYLFINKNAPEFPSGDMPEGVTIIEYGWTEEDQYEQKIFFEENNFQISCLPSIVYWKSEYTYIYNDENEGDQLVYVPAGWKEIRLSNCPDELNNWQSIIEYINQ